MAEQLIGARIKALRERRGLSQDSLAQLFGFRDRQTVSAIETGIRRRLEGLPYRMAAQALLPDERLSEWVLLQVAER